MEDLSRSSISLIPTLSPLTMAQPRVANRDEEEAKEEEERRLKKNHPATCLTESGR